ncbi:MAG TPA: transcription antitermination factor NusB, partial [Blastocatellia bacterium]|nr:transcription antitermination factor NusB [Blastocatellia bacterium]
MPEAKANRRVSPARQTAFDILRRVEQEGSFASTLIAALPEVELSREDRALTQELVLGTLRWRATLDFLIASYTGRRIEKLDLPVVIALRLGIYQIRFLTRIPVSAAVNESVKLVKRARLVSAATLTNAVLRRAVERRDDPPGVDMPAGLGRTAIEVSHPRWMLERWERSIGYEQMRELALANNQAPAVCFRVNTLRWSTEDAIAELEREGVKVRASEMTAGAFVAEHGSGLAGTRAAKGGLIYIQDEASQLVSLAVAAEPGQKILDLCAAPGSKSTHIATLTGDRSWIAACDVHHRRLAVLKESASRLGIKSISRLAADAAHSLPFSEDAQFDRVLLDAPCSGTGTLRQHPEIKWR